MFDFQVVVVMREVAASHAAFRDRREEFPGKRFDDLSCMTGWPNRARFFLDVVPKAISAHVAPFATGLQLSAKNNASARTLLGQGSFGRAQHPSRVLSCQVIWCCQTGDIYIAHNEDASIYDVNSTVLVEAINGVNGGPGFTALVYLGQTPSNAFGFNTKGVVFTMNKLSPKYPYTEGVGRVFVGRSLLDSNGFEDAINIATQKWKLIAGHNYQIGLANSDMAVSIEVAPIVRLCDVIQLICHLIIPVEMIQRNKCYLLDNLLQ